VHVAEISADIVGAYGKAMSLDGYATGGLGVYDVVGRDSFPCPPALTILPHRQRRALHMIYHS